MAAQIDMLRTQFEQMNMAQKKAFIERLKVQLKGNNTPFLNECIQKYNVEALGGSAVSVQTSANMSTNGKRSNIGLIIGICVLVLVAIVTVVFVLNFIGGNGDIVGTWESNWDSGGGQRYTFNSDDTFSFEYKGSSSRNLGNISMPQDKCGYRGTYTISGKNILLDINPDSIYTDGLGGLGWHDLDKFIDSGEKYMMKEFKFSLDGKKLTISNGGGDKGDKLSKK